MRSASLLVLALLLSGCQTFPDVPWCTEISSEEGYCFYWLSQKEVRVNNKGKMLNGKMWNQIRRESVLCPTEECFVPQKKFLENTCRQNKGMCPEQVGKF